MKRLLFILLAVTALAVTSPGAIVAFPPVVRNYVTTNSPLTNVIVRVPAGTLKNADAALGLGALQLPSADYGVGVTPPENGRNGLEFWPNASIPQPSTQASPPDAFIRSYSHWGGSFPTPTMHIGSQGPIRIEAGFGIPTPSAGNYISFGNEDSNQKLRINYVNFSTTNGTDSLGYGLPLYFESAGTVGGTRRYGTPAIQGWFSGTNSGGNLLDGTYAGEMIFWSRGPEQNTTMQVYGTNTAIEVGRTLTNGWRFNGAVNYAQTLPLAAGTNFFLDFNAGSAQTVNLTAVTTNRIVTTNLFRASNTEMLPRIFRIVAGNADRSLRWPGWSVVSDTGTDTLPTFLQASKVLLLRVTAWGNDDTNCVAQFAIGADASVGFDADAQAFFTAATITDATQKSAVDGLVKSLKGSNLWTNMIALYPFVGQTSGKHAFNLKNPATFTITWNGTVTHDANGVTGNGTTGYGAVPLDFTTAIGQQARSNFHFAVYNRVTTPTDAGAFGGGRNVSSIGFGLTREAASVGVRGAMNTLGPNAIVNVSTDLRGIMILNRFNDEAAFDIYTRLGNTSTSSTTASVPTTNPFLMAYNYNGSASSFSTANLAFASFGWGYSADQLATLAIIVNNFEVALSRNAP